MNNVERIHDYSYFCFLIFTLQLSDVPKLLVYFPNRKRPSQTDRARFLIDQIVLVPTHSDRPP